MANTKWCNDYPKNLFEWIDNKSSREIKFVLPKMIVDEIMSDDSRYENTDEIEMFIRFMIERSTYLYLQNAKNKTKKVKYKTVITVTDEGAKEEIVKQKPKRDSFVMQADLNNEEIKNFVNWAVNKKGFLALNTRDNDLYENFTYVAWNNRFLNWQSLKNKEQCFFVLPACCEYCDNSGFVVGRDCTPCHCDYLNRFEIMGDNGFLPPEEDNQNV